MSTNNLQAKAQSRFPFLGKMRMPGDIITHEELSKVSTAVRDSLRNQGMVILESEDGTPLVGAGIPDYAQRIEATCEQLTAAVAGLKDLIAASAANEARMIEAVESLSGRFTGLTETVLKALPGRGPKPKE